MSSQKRENEKKSLPVADEMHSVPGQTSRDCTLEESDIYCKNSTNVAKNQNGV